MKLNTFLTTILLGIILGNILLAMCAENTNTSNMSNKNESKEKNNLNSGIFLTEKAFKYKNAKKTNLKSTYTSRSKTNSAHKNAAQSQIQSETNSENSNKNKVMDPETTGPVLHEGWVKYFKYSDGVLNAPLPKGFDVNPEFKEQKKHFPDEDYKGKNPDGTYNFIRDQHYFYLHLFQNIIAINSSKQNISRKLVDTFTISEIANVFEDSKDNKRNGVLDYGRFNEGYCMKIATKDSTNTVWIICTDSESEKDELLSKIKALKIQDQHNNGVILLANSKALKNKETIGNLLGKKGDDEPKFGKKNTAPVDGFWLTLQNWSQCNKKCDGGISTFHRMCVPPKNGGKPCDGEPVITKKCNMHPCPSSGNTDENLRNKNNTTVNDPIIKILPFTDQPQRYTLCKIKESDLMIYEDGKDPNKKDDPLFKGKKIDEVGGLKLPCRVVMNPQTLTVYSGEKFETIHLSFTLKKTRFYEAKNKKNCFKLYETTKKYITLCPYGAEVSNNEFKEWKRDFEVFKTRCDRPKKGLSDQEQKALDDKIRAKMEAAKNEALAEARAATQLKRAVQSQGDLAVLVKTTQNVAMKALQKEQTLEELIKQEAEEKNRLEEERMRKLIEAEKQKKDCVLKAIKEKQLENQLEEKAKEIKETINSIKQEAVAQVLVKRNNLKKVLNQINQKAALKRNRLRQELLNVRMSLAQELGKAYKRGNINNCVDAMSSQAKRNNYCISAFSEDFTNLQYCKNTEEFCELCCGTEFGEMLSNDKNICMQKVCPRRDKKNGNDGNSGRWVAKQEGNWTFQKGLEVAKN